MSFLKSPSPGACSGILAFSSIIWGVAFIFQKYGGNAIGGFSYNAIRMMIGALVILICTSTFTDKIGISKRPENKSETKKQIIVGIICGLFLAVASNLQQFGIITGDSVGKAGFITTFYIILVPIINLFFGMKGKWNIWISVVIALAGLYFMCVTGKMIFSFSDLLLLGCALFYSFQIITIDHYAKSLDSLRLSGMQFLVCGTISLILALIFEICPYEGGLVEWIKLLASGKLWLSFIYLGVFSCGMGYTFQIIGQKNLDPTIASILMSLESLFALLAGWLILGETIPGIKILGCALMMLAVILTQIDFGKIFRKRRKNVN